MSTGSSSYSTSIKSSAASAIASLCCRHRGDFLAHETHHAVGKQRHVDNFLADLGAGEIGAGQHRDDAGQRARFGDIDAS